MRDDDKDRPIIIRKQTLPDPDEAADWTQRWADRMLMKFIARYLVAMAIFAVVFIAFMAGFIVVVYGAAVVMSRNGM